MKKSILLIASIMLIIGGCGDSNKAVTDLMPKIGSDSLTNQTGYNIFSKLNISRSIQANKSISREFRANTEDKTFVTQVLKHIQSTGIASPEEKTAIDELIANLDSPQYTSTVNDIYSILKINNIDTSSNKEMLRVFMDKIKKDSYDENMLKLNNVVDLSEKIDCTTSQNLSNVFAFQKPFPVEDTLKKEAEQRLKDIKSELGSLDSEAPEYADMKQALEEEATSTEEYIKDFDTQGKDNSKILIKNALASIYDIEFYECVTTEQLQYGGTVNTKNVQDKSFTTVKENFEGSLYEIAWLNKGKLSKDFFGDLTLRLNNHQKLKDNYEDYTRVDSVILESNNKKLYSIFFKGVTNNTYSQTFYNIDLDSRTKLPKNQYIKNLQTYSFDDKDGTYLTYSHFNSLGIAMFSCDNNGAKGCSSNSSFNATFAKLTSSDASLRAKAKSSPVGENDSSKDFFTIIDEASAKKLGLMSSISDVKKAVSSTKSGDMSSLLSKIEKVQNSSFYLKSLSY